VRVKDVKYVTGTSKKANRLDVYLPARLAGHSRAPVLIFVHGGGWRKGSKDMRPYREFAALFARQGYVTVVPDYRLSGEARHPAQIEDVAAAFAWTHRNIQRHGGDPHRIFISGHSAGGHLVSLLAADPRYLNKHQLDNSAIRGVMALSAVLDINRMDRKSRERAAEPTFGKDPGVWRQVSPISHVKGALPPFLVLHASRDPEALVEQARAFAAALREKGYEVMTARVEGKGHVSMLLTRGGRATVMHNMMKFLSTLRRPQR